MKWKYKKLSEKFYKDEKYDIWEWMIDLRSMYDE